MITRDEVLEALRHVYDPELGVNVVDLGLVYEAAVQHGTVRLRMTMTSRGCPLSGTIEAGVREMLRLQPGLQHLDFALVWDPPWSPEQITPDGRRALGLA